MTLRDEVRGILVEYTNVPDEDGAPLDVDSLTLVTLVEALEDRFALRVAPREAVPENFGSVAALCAFLEQKRK